MVSPRDAIHDAIGVLNDLIQTCRDGEEGFRTAADGVDDANLKRLFASYAQQRAGFIQELQREVRQLGGDPEDSGHAAGAVHRGWINIKAAVTGKDEGAIISECERGEDVAKRNYQHALEQTLPSDVRLLIERQYMQVKDAHDHVRSLEKAHSNK
jgi:uncharacterized protein (TIGR02284 family)